MIGQDGIHHGMTPQGRPRPPLEGALYAMAGGIFTLVLLFAQVISIRDLDR